MVAVWWTVGIVAALSLCTAGIALFVAARAALRPVRHERGVTQLRTEFAEVLEEIEKLQHIVTTKSKRDVMRERRSNGADPTKMRPGESPAEWKARMRAGVRAGEIKPPRFVG